MNLETTMGQLHWCTVVCLLKDFKQRVADFLCEKTGGTTHSRYDIETA